MRDSGKKTENPVPALGRDGERRQERSRATRRELIAAARRVFARDGFEMARIEDIATLAHKTRGAFYANFEDKEAVFFALMEEQIDRDVQAVRLRFEAAETPKKRLEELAQYLLEVCRDKGRMLLAIEFKLYAIRHPEHHGRLVRLHAAMAVRCADMKIDQLLPELQQAEPAKKRRQAALFSAVLEGLTLNRLFDPSALQEQQMLQLIHSALESAMQRDQLAASPLHSNAETRKRTVVATATLRGRLALAKSQTGAREHTKRPV